MTLVRLRSGSRGGKGRNPAFIPPSTDGVLQRRLEELRRRLDPEAALAADPLGLVHRYRDPDDQEVAGLLVAVLAYGRATTIRERAGVALAALGPRPSQGIAEARRRRRLDGFVYRFQRGQDLPRWLAAVQRYRNRYGSLGAGFRAGVRPDEPHLGPAMARFVEGLRAEVRGPLTYGLRYLLPSTRDGGAAKRLALYLRWMVRPADGIDLGVWSDGRLASRLVMPLDTHVARLGRALSLCRRRTPDLRMALEITDSLRRLCPEDPLRYDMPLCHLGISGACPSRREPSICRDCGIRSICRWGSKDP
jgi:uncharacterized protein (TIGR02757 family)